MLRLALVPVFCFFAACQTKPVSPAATTVLNVQPFDGMSDTIVAQLAQELQLTGSTVVVQPTIAIPGYAYRTNRNRYRADSLLNFLNQKTNNNAFTIGITNKDISCSKGSTEDWGIMGLGLCPGKSCIVSTYRLSKNNLSTQLYKLALHELGHTQGLPHCANKTCLMRDAEGGNPLDYEKAFCVRCSGYLAKRGWNLMSQSMQLQ